MRSRILIFGLLALAFGGGTIYMVQQWMAQERASFRSEVKKTPQVQGARVLVATRSIEAGEFLGPKLLRWQSWPDDKVVDSYVTQKTATPAVLQSMVGAVIRKPLAAGQPLLKEHVVRPGERGFLAAVLWPGMRAISVPVNEISGVAGLVFPGDRVDLILTRRIRVDKVYRHSSETLLKNVRILAIGQRTSEVKNAIVPGTKPANSSRTATLVKTVTIELTPKDVEMIGVARTLGSLSLSLRSLSDEEALQRLRAMRLKFNRGVGPQPASTQPATIEPATDKPTATLTASKDSDPADKNRRTEDPADPLKHDKPERGRSITVDYQVSRALRLGDPTRTMTIIRGSKAEKVKVE